MNINKAFSVDSLIDCTHIYLHTSCVLCFIFSLESECNVQRDVKTYNFLTLTRLKHVILSLAWPFLETTEEKTRKQVNWFECFWLFLDNFLVNFVSPLLTFTWIENKIELLLRKSFIKYEHDDINISIIDKDI